MCELNNNIIRKSLAIILLAAVFVQLTGWVTYTHSHVLKDGTIVTHTHPYNKGSDSNTNKTHLHNSFDQVFADSSHGIILFGFSIFLLLISWVVGFIGFRIQKVLHRYETFQAGRAPPIVS